MSTVTISRDKALKKVEENRRLHAQEYEVSLRAYKKTLEDKMEEELKRLKATGDKEGFKVARFPEPPEHHLEDYDQYIEMLTWDVRQEIELDQEEFNQLIRDKWSWSRSWDITKTLYRGERD